MVKVYNISHDYVNLRIDKWIKININKVPQSLIEKNLRNKRITVNKLKVKSSYKLKINDKIYLNNFNPINKFLTKRNPYIPTVKDIKESNSLIVENNDNFCVINKPSGLAVQGGTRISRNLVDLLRKNKIFYNTKPFVVHRIDKETSGLIIFAKNRKYAQLFTSLFRIRKIHKSYLCICYGEMKESKGNFDYELSRCDRGKKVYERAITNYKILDKNSKSTLLILKPITGRKHQIRRQLFSAGFPIMGDTKYNFPSFFKNKTNFLMLHAYSIKFMINETKYQYKVNAPEHFTKMLNKKKLTLSKYT